MKKDIDATWIGAALVLVFGLLLVGGCSDRDLASPQLGFQPAGHDNVFKVAESLPIGDNAGGDLLKDIAVKETTISMQAEKIDHLAQNLAESQQEISTYADTIKNMESRNAGRNLIDFSGGGVLLLVFGVCVFAIMKWGDWKKVTEVQARAIKGSASVLKLVRPQVRKLPPRIKRNLDRFLKKRGLMVKEGD